MSGYIGSTPVPQATQHREAFTATEGQTSFATAGYTPQFLDVFLNGSHLSPADFVATNGSDVVLVVAASADDICDIISYSPFEVNSQTFTGTTTMDVSLTTGVLTANGGAVFNEASADVDFRVESNGNANMLFVDGGNDRLQIGSAATDDDQMFQLIKAGGSAGFGIHSNRAAAGGSSFIMSHNRNNAVGSFTILNSGDTLGRITFQGCDGGDIKTEGAQISAEVDGTPGANDMPGRLVFSTTADGAAAITERVRIDAAGRVMIGTTTEGQNQADNFTVSDAGNMGMTLRSTDSGECSIFFSDGTSGAAEYRGSLQYIHSDNSMRFATNGAERMRVAAAGQIALNTGGVFDIAGSNGSGIAINDNTGIQMIDSRCTTTSNTFRMRFFNGDDDAAKGAIRTDGDATVFATSSDYRLKENVVYDWDATTRLKQLKPCRFNWISDDSNTAIDGFLAHEAQAVVPNAVNGEKDATEVWENCVVTPSGQSAARNVTEEEWTAGKSTTTDEDGNTVAAKYASNTTWTASHTTKLMQAIDHSFFIPLLVKTIQELEARITALEG